MLDPRHIHNFHTFNVQFLASIDKMLFACLLMYNVHKYIRNDYGLFKMIEAAIPTEVSNP